VSTLFASLPAGPLLLFALKSCALAVLAWCMLKLGRGAAPVHRSLVARFAIGSLLALPAAMLLLPDWSVSLSGETRAVDLALTLFGSGSSVAAASRSAGATASWSDIAVVVWALGFLAVASRFLSGWLAARRIVRFAEPVTDRRLLSELAVVRCELNVSRPVRLGISGRVTVPFTSGLLAPFIIVPISFGSDKPSRRRQILIHETAHIKRHDVLWMLLAHFAAAVHWFNPFVWSIRRSVILEAERACDDLVLLAGCDGSNYAGHLLDAIRLLHQKQSTATPGVGMARRSFIEGRIMSILNTRVRRPRAAGLAILTTALFTLLVVPILAAMHLTPVDVIPTRAFAAESEALDEGLPAEDQFVPVEEYPEMIYQEIPVYPPKAEADNIEGDVWIKSLVDSTGTVRTAKIAKTSGVPMLDSAAVTAAPRCRYKPAIAHGRPVAVWVTYKVTFALDGVKEK